MMALSRGRMRPLASLEVSLNALLAAVAVAVTLLLFGDFLSTFFYHVPEHVFGKFHTLIHHSKNRSFLHYAVLHRDPWALLDGCLGALPYFVFIPWLWQLSPIGTILGLILGELHVIWRHTTALDWQTPKAVQVLCAALFITTPERHWQHHENAQAAYGDIFTFYDQPAQAWLRWLGAVRRKMRRYWLQRQRAKQLSV